MEVVLATEVAATEAVVYAAADCPKDIAATIISELVNGTNTTMAPKIIPSYVPMVQIAKTCTTLIVTLGMMISMGCVITFRETFEHVKKPFGILIGFLCQYGILPLTGFALSHLFQLEPPYALGVLIMSCCPGGTTSNILTYWIHGDVSLSICMTTCSTILAFGMMPLLLYIYSRSWTDNSAVVPYTQIVITLVCILVPVVVGMFIRYKSKPIADKVSQVLATVALVGIGIIVILEAILRSETYTKHPDLWIIGFMLPAVGAGTSFLVGTFVKLPEAQKRTVAVETGWQNLGVALTLILLSFPKDAGRVGAFVSIYLVIQSGLVYALLPVGHFLKKRQQAKSKEHAIEFRNGDVIEVHDESTVKINLANRNGYKEIPKDTESVNTTIAINGDIPDGTNEETSTQKEAILPESVI